MPFAVAGAAIGAGASIYASNKQAGAVKDASNQQNALLGRQRDDLGPWRDSGGVANTQASDLLGLNGQEAADSAFSTYHTSPGYQWQLDQGLRAVDAGAAAKGMLRSGATLQAEQQFGQGLANQDFTSYYNRLFGLSQQGQASAAGGASTANVGALAAGNTGTQEASIYGNLGKGISSGANDLFNNKDVQGYVKGLFSSGGSSYGNADSLAYTASMNPTSPGAYGPGF